MQATFAPEGQYVCSKSAPPRNLCPSGANVNLLVDQNIFLIINAMPDSNSMYSSRIFFNSIVVTHPQTQATLAPEGQYVCSKSAPTHPLPQRGNM